MKNAMKTFALALAGALAAAAPSAAAANSVDPALASAVSKANSEWEAAMKKGDAAKIAAPYEADAVFLGVDGTCTTGRAAIEQMYRGRFAKNGLAIATQIESKSLVQDGDLGYEWGYGETTMNRLAKMETSGGRYFTIWRKGPDGTWRIFRNVVLPGR
jgi:uncharacterized protein (TIGR02246 family)